MGKKRNGSVFQEVGSTTLEYFSEGKVAFLREVNEHPQLKLELIARQDDGEGAVIGTVAAYCNLSMDGTYGRDEIEDLYPILVERLQRIRRITIQPLVDVDGKTIVH